MAKILIVVGHPHGDSYCEALGVIFVAGSRGA
jgi:putative NADPH-quinone reductase